MAYRYILDIQDIDAFMEEVNEEGYIENVRKEVFATANMFFQIRLTHPLNNYYEDEGGYLTRNNVTLSYTRTYRGEDGNTVTTEEETVAGSETSGDVYIDQVNENNQMLVIREPEVGVYDVKIMCDDLQLDEYQITFLPISSAGMFLEEDVNGNADEKGDYYHLSQDSLDVLVEEGRAKLLGVIDFDETGDGVEFSYLDHLKDDKTYYQYPILPWSQSSYAWTSDFLRSSWKDWDYASYRIATTSAGTQSHTAAGEYVYGHGNATTKGQDAYLYVNVANEPGKMLELDWDDPICSNSRLYLTFWINEHSAHIETGNVEVSVTGINKSTGKEENIRTYITGYVPKYWPKEEACNKKYIPQEGNFDYQHPLYNNGTDEPEICRGKWMQVCYSFITEFNPEDYARFTLTLNNNTKSSLGADFGLDDIRVYAVNPTVIAQQTSQCDEKYYVDVRLPYEQLAYTYSATTDQGEKTGYFSFWKPKGDGTYEPIHYNYKGTDEDNQNYGSFKFHTQLDENPLENAETRGDDEMYREEIAGEWYLVFNTEPTIDVLTPGEEYLVVFYSDKNEAEYWIEEVESLNLGTGADSYSDSETGEAWDLTCLVYSQFTVWKSQVILIDGVPSTDEMSVCYNQKPLIRPAMQGMEGNYKYDGYYDVFLGSLDGYSQYAEAITNFRNADENATSPDGVEFEGKETLIQNKDKFIFHCQQIEAEYPEGSDHSASQDIFYTFIPIIPEEEAGESTVYCWDPYEFKLTFNGDAPVAQIGFNDVEYSDDYVSNIRVGLDDLTSGKDMEIPLRGLKDDDVIQAVENNRNVYLDIESSSTNDPAILEYISGLLDPWEDKVLVGTISNLSSDETGGGYKLDVKFDKLKDKDEDEKIIFKEGYYYGFRLKYTTDEESACEGDLRFTMHVVPKYQKWIGKAQTIGIMMKTGHALRKRN